MSIKTDISFDLDHDMHLAGADIAFTDEDNNLIQRLKIRLQFLLGEWFLDNTVGIPYTQEIFKAKMNLQDIYTIFRDEIKNTEGVEKIEELEVTSDPGARGLKVNFSVNGGQTGSVEVQI